MGVIMIMMMKVRDRGEEVRWIRHRRSWTITVQGSEQKQVRRPGPNVSLWAFWDCFCNNEQRIYLLAFLSGCDSLLIQSG